MPVPSDDPKYMGARAYAIRTGRQASILVTIGQGGGKLPHTFAVLPHEHERLAEFLETHQVVLEPTEQASA